MKVRNLLEKIGIERYSKPGQYQIEDVMKRYISKKNGTFFEAGANDGFKQSNTYYLEKIKRWSGVLVEGIPRIYKKCINNRQNSSVYNYALVPPKKHGEIIKMKYSGLMSLVEGSRGSREKDEKHIKKGLDVQKEVEKKYEVKVKGVTINHILEKEGIEKIDFMSIDLEGYEYEAMKGMSIEKYKPSYILAEVNQEETKDLLEGRYRVVERLSEKDFLFEIV